MYKLKIGQNKVDTKEYHQLDNLLKAIQHLKDFKVKKKDSKREEYSVGNDISKTIKKIRNNLKNNKYSITLSRPGPALHGKEKLKEDGELIERKSKPATVTHTIEFEGVANKMKAYKEARDKIVQDIRKARQDARPKIEEYHVRDGFKAKKLEYTYLEANTFVKTLARKIRREIIQGTSQVPKTADNYIGVEIELASTLTREQLADIMVDNELGKFVRIKTDGSIGNPENKNSKLLQTHRYGHEFTVLVLESEFEPVITKLCDVLNKQCNIKIDHTCGLHVHLDMRNKDHAHAFSNLVGMQHFLYAMLPANRKTGKYSPPVKGRQWREFENHYHGINTTTYERYKTIEIRMHSGTTQGDKINNWIKLILAISNAEEFSRAPNSIKKFKSMVNISEDVATYMEARINKFAEQHKQLEQKGVTFDIPAVEPPETAAVDTSVREDSEAA